MANRKKKPNETEQRRISLIQHKKEFLKQFKALLNLYAQEDIASLIPSAYLDKVYECRFQVFKLVEDSEYCISVTDMKQIKLFLSSLVRNATVAIKNDGTQVTLFDYFTLGRTITSLNMILEDKTFPQSDRIKAILLEFKADDEIYLTAYNTLDLQLFTLSGMCTDIERCFICYSYNSEVITSPVLAVLNLIKIK